MLLFHVPPLTESLSHFELISYTPFFIEHIFYIAYYGGDTRGEL